MKQKSSILIRYPYLIDGRPKVWTLQILTGSILNSFLGEILPRMLLSQFSLVDNIVDYIGVALGILGSIGVGYYYFQHNGKIWAVITASVAFGFYIFQINTINVLGYIIFALLGLLPAG